MRVTNFLVAAATDRAGHRIESRPGRFQFFALDWIIEAPYGHSYLLEGNGNPSIREYDDTGLTPAFWESMLELVELVHAHPEDLAPGGVLSVHQRFAFKGWRLSYNQLEVAAAGEPYNPCKFNQYEVEKHALFGFAPGAPLPLESQRSGEVVAA